MQGERWRGGRVGSAGVDFGGLHGNGSGSESFGSIIERVGRARVVMEVGRRDGDLFDAEFGMWSRC